MYFGLGAGGGRSAAKQTYKSRKTFISHIANLIDLGYLHFGLFLNIIIVFFQRQTIESRATVISCPV